MKKTGKIDYLEMSATGGTLDSVKAFYSAAFSWSFQDYGPTYSAFDEGLEGGFQTDGTEAPAKPLPVLYSENLEDTLASVENAGGKIVRPIFSFPGAVDSTSPIRLATNLPYGEPEPAVLAFCLAHAAI